jgi:hypothetical protein
MMVLLTWEGEETSHLHVVQTPSQLTQNKENPENSHPASAPPSSLHPIYHLHL